MTHDFEEYLASLVQMRDAAQQRAFISNNPATLTLDFVELLAGRIREMCNVARDPAFAAILADTALFLASKTNSLLALAYATRSKAHVLYTMRKSADAQPLFQRAAELFAESGRDGEVGRTLVAQIDNMLYLSLYEDAIRVEPRARTALQKANDTRYLATLEIGLGNLYHRLNRFTESLARYDRALQMTDKPLDIAAIGLGRAHSLTGMNRFDEASQVYEATKRHCDQHGLQLIADMADRGMVEMQFRRGNYSTALRILEKVRRKHAESNDTRRVGLCDLDRAEIYLQLNLFEDTVRLAAQAHQLFDQLGNRYEAAKCLMFQGIAEFKLLRDKAAEISLSHAQEIFQQEGNDMWVAAVDLWRAQLLMRHERFLRAQEIADHAALIFERQQVPVRAANARVLSAQSWQELGNSAAALAEAEKALEELEGFHAPWVSYQCHNTLGRLRELDGDLDQAEQLYLKAIAEMESLRGNIRLDEMRLSFGKDKYQVYENIVNLNLNRGTNGVAFNFVERSKSRTLIDLLERNLDTVWDPGAEESPRLLRIRKIREELNILYSRLNEVAGSARALVADPATKHEIDCRERELVALLREVASEKSGWASLQSMKPAGIDDMQRMLTEEEALVEYYTIGQQFQAFVITRNTFHVIRNLACLDEVRRSLKGVAFQLSKFHLESAYLETHASSLLKAIQYHLNDLYGQLIEKIRPLVTGKKLIIVPHQVLHYVPFHALHDGANYLIDGCEVVYGPSASVLKICREKSVPERHEDLVLAVPDELTPHINEEVQALRALLPRARFLVGPEAREETLRQYGPSARKLHIAAHGIFRSDNPMFSSLRLGDSWLNLFDIFNLQLGAELTTLSACETGMSAVWEGDELLGLARGFLYAGTPSLVVSLWMVNDRSTAELMRGFYTALEAGLTKSSALREAMLGVKAAFPHPYYWAPFVLMGRS